MRNTFRSSGAAGKTPNPKPKNRPPAKTHHVPPSARAVAVQALHQCFKQRLGLDEAFSAAPGLAALDGRDRAFAYQLAMTTLRRFGQIDKILNGWLRAPLPESCAPVLWVLRLGLAQLGWMDTPPHAAVHSAVELVEQLGFGGHKGLVNALLQRFVREGAEAKHATDESVDNCPTWLWKALSEAYGWETAWLIAAAHRAEPPLDITLKHPQEAAHWAETLGAERLSTGSLRLAAHGAVDQLPGFAEDAWWVQDAAASLPARLLGDVAGKVVIDAGAAPGGKTAQLAAAGAKVLAVDHAAPRIKRMQENLARLALSTDIIEADLLHYTPPALVDAVLLDAPCSATGTLRRHPEGAWIKRPERPAVLARTQRAMLERALTWLKPGGVLVYAVCSLLPEEGEALVQALLNTQPKVRLDAIRAEEIGGFAEAITPAGTLRTLPCHMAEKGGMDGFFAARLVRLA